MEANYDLDWNNFSFQWEITFAHNFFSKKKSVGHNLLGQIPVNDISIKICSVHCPQLHTSYRIEQNFTNHAISLYKANKNEMCPNENMFGELEKKQALVLHMRQK